MTPSRTTAKALAAGAALVLAGAANADVLDEFHVGTWAAGAYADETGRFSHCAASVRYRSGTTLVFTMSGNEDWAFAVANAGWSLPPGSSGSVRYSIDAGPALTGRAVMISDRMARVDLPGDTSLFDAFRTGETLQVRTGKTILQFHLTGTDRMLTSIRKCARTHEAAARAATTPFVAEAKSDPAPRMSRTERRREASGAAVALLDQSKIRYRPLTRTEAPELNAGHDAVWKMNGAVGMMRIIEGKVDTNALIAQIADRDAAACRGSHAIAPVREPETAAGLTLMSVCRTGERWNAVHLLLPRMAGGVYHVTVLGGGTHTTTVATLAEQLRISALAQPGGVAPNTPA